jgi:formylglycine-generating enzyme required for sulfatase activity
MMVKRISIVTVIVFVFLWNTFYSISQSQEKEHVAFSGMSTEQAAAVRMAAAEYFNLPVEIKIPLDDAVSIELVLIPPGEFLMGSQYSKERSAEKFGGQASAYDLEHPQHPVRITKPFYLGKFEITQKQWNVLMDGNPSPRKMDALPVEHVSWDDCKEFCKRLSNRVGKTIRLPTEAEWEFACRAGTKTAYYFGDRLSSEQANFLSDGAVQVGSYQPNAWGLYDMHGNITEWVEDYYYQYTKDLKIDPWETEYPYGGRMLRGGDYADDKKKLRSAYRYAHLKSMGDQISGLRIAVAVDDDKERDAD